MSDDEKFFKTLEDHFSGLDLDSVLPMYVLDGKTPRRAKWTEYLRWRLSGADPHVGLDIIGGVEISTVFLGQDAACGMYPEAPRLFETMIFGGRHNLFQARCTTWKEAEAMHAEATKMVRESMQ
jgi:hypothetical protein